MVLVIKSEHFGEKAHFNQSPQETEVKCKSITADRYGPEDQIPEGGWRGAEDQIPKGGWRVQSK